MARIKLALAATTPLLSQNRDNGQAASEKCITGAASPAWAWPRNRLRWTTVQHSVTERASTYLHRCGAPTKHSHPMISRDKILSAAARVYAEAGFRGSTTRRIADEAGMNEVTIFRLFGSKAALLAEAVRHSAPVGVTPLLPAQPGNPERELTAWATAQLDFLRIHGSMIRKSLAEVEELPGMGTKACEGCMRGRSDLRRYARKLSERWGTTRVADLDTAVAMLIGAIMSDAIARDVMPAGFPEPPARAAAAYVRVFLRAIGKPVLVAPRRGKTRARRSTTKS